MAGQAIKLKCGVPVTIAVPCAGLDPGAKVTVKVFEPHAMGGDPVETIDATVDEAGGVAQAKWTYDHSKYADKVSAARYVLVCEGAGRTTIGGPVEFFDTFKATLKDSAGHPASCRLVMLHAARGADVPTASDPYGKVNIDVPPGTYVVELLGPDPQASPSKDLPPIDPDDPLANAGVVPSPATPADEQPEPDAPAGPWTVRVLWPDDEKLIDAVRLSSTAAGYDETVPRSAAKLVDGGLEFTFKGGDAGLYDVDLVWQGDKVQHLTSFPIPDGVQDGTTTSAGDAAPAGSGGVLTSLPGYACTDDPPGPPKKTCHELSGGHFDFDRAFVRPDGIAALQGVFSDLQDASLRAMVFGHTDTVGAEDYNKALSERRARSVTAVLTQDPDSWEDLYTKEKWGTKPIQVMLNAVRPDGTDKLDEDGQLGPKTQAGISDFQTRQGLPASGQADAATRRALYLAYMKKASDTPIDVSRLKSFDGTPYMGCGVFNPFTPKGADEKSRRVVIMSFDPSSEPVGLPCKIGDLGPCHQNLLPDDQIPVANDRNPYFRCKVFRDIASHCPCNQGPDVAATFQYGLYTGADAAWGPNDKLHVVSEDGTDVKDYPISSGQPSGDLTWFSIADPKTGVRYKGSVVTANGEIGLWGLVELARLTDPSDPQQYLPAPDPQYVVPQDELAS